MIFEVEFEVSIVGLLVAAVVVVVAVMTRPWGCLIPLETVVAFELLKELFRNDYFKVLKNKGENLMFYSRIYENGDIR